MVKQTLFNRIKVVKKNLKRLYHIIELFNLVNSVFVCKVEAKIENELEKDRSGNVMSTTFRCNRLKWCQQPNRRSIPMQSIGIVPYMFDLDFALINLEL
ncbi:hypothetical protein BLOT_009254 [Blomia tropicalis]|nr:hypothetical protein BLOT_009254 [Blomia tropicalis]